MKANYIRETDGPVLVIGDTHGNDKLIMYRIRSRKFKRAVIFHVGDFGVGFLSSPEMELLKLEKLNNFLVERYIFGSIVPRIQNKKWNLEKLC
jgi:hypothetical protein